MKSLCGLSLQTTIPALEYHSQSLNIITLSIPIITLTALNIITLTVLRIIRLAALQYHITLPFLEEQNLFLSVPRSPSLALSVRIPAHEARLQILHIPCTPHSKVYISSDHISSD